MYFLFAWDHKKEILKREKRKKFSMVQSLKLKKNILITGGNSRFCKYLNLTYQNIILFFYYKKIF